MNDLRDLYQEVIFDHNRNPRNYGRLEEGNCQAEGFNPLCGDELHLSMIIGDDDRIREIRFEGHGCAISTASASIMTELLVGKSVDEVRHLFSRFHDMVTADPPPVDIEELGKAGVLQGVREFPARVKCATLAWHTAMAAINHDDQPASTE